MNFHELEDSLPNGFHDAELKSVTMNYVNRTLCLDMYVFIGELDSPEMREVYRPARITLENVAYFVIESPDESRPWNRPGAIRIDTGLGTPSQSQNLVPGAPAKTIASWIYLNELNRFILFAAESAILEWTGQEENRGT